MKHRLGEVYSLAGSRAAQNGSPHPERPPVMPRNLAISDHSAIRTRLGFLVLRYSVFAAATLYAAAPAHADFVPENMTPGEIARLPPYCPVRLEADMNQRYRGLQNMTPPVAHFVGLMGDAFWAMHHYCWAQIRVNRALAGGMAPVIRNGTLLAAIADYEFVLHNSKPDFVMLPEVYLKIGDTHVLMKNYPKASEAFAKSRSLKPDFWPPYSHWANALELTVSKKAALAHLEEGMRAAPKAAALQAQYKRLGGDPVAFLKSLPPPPAASQPAEAEAAPAAPTAPTAPAASAASQ